MVGVRALLLCALLSVASASGPRKSATLTFQQAGRHHKLAYDVVQSVPDDSILELEGTEGLASLDCDADGTHLQLVMQSGEYAKELAGRLNSLLKQPPVFLTGNGTMCDASAAPRQQILLRRVMSANYSGNTVSIGTVQAQYGELIEEGYVSYSSTPSDSLIDHHMCVGVNVGDHASCNSAAKAIPLFSKGGLTVTCESCFAAFQTDLFFDVTFGFFTIKSFQAGYRNMAIDAAMELDLKADFDKTFLAIDKDLFEVGGPDHPLISFKVGPIPFTLWYQGNGHLTADFSCSGSAEVKAGVAMHHSIGDNYITWDSKNKWQHHTTSPSLSFTPTTFATAQAECDGSVSFVPTVSLHANQVFTVSTSLHPSVSATVKASSETMKVCENGQYDVNLQAEVDAHADLLGAHILDYHWGPTKLFDKQGTLPQLCLPLGKAGEVIV